MTNELGLVCDICFSRISKGHVYIPYIPGGYGEYKDKPFDFVATGDMHASHLSTSDFFRVAKVRA